MRVLFMGTPALAATVLDVLAHEHEVVGVFTRPDAVRGRGKTLVASPVKLAAQKLSIPVYEPVTLRDDTAAKLMADLNPEVACVVAYGAILPTRILELPKYGCLNVHASLLPRWRGAAPIERAILARDHETGVCIMKMEEGLDTGPFCIREVVELAGAYRCELEQTLANRGADSLIRALAQVEDGTVRWQEQSEEGIVYASKLEKGELDCDSSDDVATIDAKVRASGASHPSRLVIGERLLAVERVSIPDSDSPLSAVQLEPGEAAVVAKRLAIGASDGVIELVQVKPAGKKSMEGRAFAAGLRAGNGARMNWGKA